jgi:hypothetical protein
MENIKYRVLTDQGDVIDKAMHKMQIIINNPRDELPEIIYITS